MGLSSDFYPPPESEDPTENKRCGPQDKTLHLNRNSEGQDEDISDLPRLGDQLLNQGQNLDRARPSICVQPDDNSADRPSKRKHDQVKSDELAIDAEETNPSRPLRPESHRADLVSEHSVKRLRSDLQAPSSSRNDVELSDSLEANYTLHRLTVPIWQRIFCFVPPVFLGRLLRVDRAFHSLLKSPEPYNYTLEHRIEDFRNPSAELIWTASRKRFAPGLPKALFGQSELDMWRLLRGNSCQVCGERKSLLTTSAMSDPWHAGPGETGIRVIWSFGVRCCGPCLLKSSEQVGLSSSYNGISNRALGGQSPLLERLSVFPTTCLTLCLYYPVSGLHYSFYHSKHIPPIGHSNGKILLQTSCSGD